MSESATSVRRLVIVHGTPGEELVQILQDSGLEAAVRSGDVTIWAPSPLILEPPTALRRDHPSVGEDR